MEKKLIVLWIFSYNFGSFWIDTAFSWTWIGSGSDLDPDAEILDWIGSRSNAVQVDRIGSRSKKIGSDYITGNTFMLWENTILVTQNTLIKTGNPTLQLKKGEWRQFHPI